MSRLLLTSLAVMAAALAMTSPSLAMGGSQTNRSAPTSSDTDADGILNGNDLCPDTAGPGPDGCPPDVDGDGVANAVDVCPFVRGNDPSGCLSNPDPDNDGVPVGFDKCPTQGAGPAVATDGCPDFDADGIPDRLDKCAGSKGDRADGCPSEVGARVSGKWRTNRRQTKMVSLVVRAPIGVRIDVTCKGPRGSCAFATQTIDTTITNPTSLTSFFGRTRVLAAGTTIGVRVTQAGRYGTFVRFTTRTGRRLPKVTERCIGLAGNLRTCASAT